LNDKSSALEGLVRGFISSPLSFLIRLSSVDWPSWRSESHRRSFPRFSLGKAFVSITLVSVPILIFSSWVHISDSTSVRGRSEELLLQVFVSRETYANVGACPEVSSTCLVLVFVLLI